MNAALHVVAASMRPRQVCRGNLARGGGVGGSRRASMRPRQVCRGNRRDKSPETKRGESFNEAPASLPGKRADDEVAVVEATLLQ